VASIGSNTPCLRHFIEKVLRALLNPPPMHMPYTFTGMFSCATCFMCLAQFLISPHLHYIQAFNLGGAGWRIGGPKTDSSSLRIGFSVDDMLLEISVRSVEEQDDLRVQYAQQAGHRAILGTTRQLFVFRDHRAALKMKARGGAGGAI